MRTVRFEATVGGRPITFRGLQPPETTYTFLYNEGGEVWGAVQFTRSGEGRVEYVQGMHRRDHAPSEAVVDSVVALMQAIESRLRPVARIGEPVAQTCDGVRC